MDIILEHGSTEDDGLDSIEMSQKKIVELFDNREENASDSSNSSKRMISKTKCRSQKNMRESINREESECSYSSSSENEISKNLNFDDSRERNSSSSEKNVNGNLKNKNASTSTLRTDRNKSTKRNKNQPSNVDARYNSGIIPHSESSSSKNTQNIDVEFNRRTSSRLEVGARTMSQQQFQKDVLERMDKITILFEQNNACISRLLQTMSFLHPTSKSDRLPELPLKSDDDFKKLEELLSKKTVDAEGHEIPAPAYTYLKERLSTIGGAHQRASVMNMLKFVITNELAMMYNWTGRKKKSFETTKLREVITDAAQMQFKKNSSDQCIKDAIQSWLSQAKQRHMYNARKN